MKRKFFTCFGVVMVIITGCNVSLKENQNSLPVFDLGSVIGKQIPDTFTWNSVAKQIVYVPLSTSAHTLFASPNLIYIDKERYYMVDYRTKTIFYTDKKGNVINSFSHVGQGPGEYIMLGYVHVNSGNSTITVFDHGGNKYLIYDLNGNIVREFFLKNKGCSDPLFISDTYMVARTREEDIYKLCITDPKLNIQKRLFPVDTTLTETERLCLFWQLNYCRNRDQAIVHYANEDTVYRINESGVNPLCIFKKGEFTLPEEEAKKMRDFTEEGSPYVQDMRIGSIPDYYLITYMWKNHFYDEIWRKADNTIVSRFSNEDGEWGIPFCLPSGKKIRINTNSLFINGNSVAFTIPASLVVEEKIAEIDEDDNPVLVIIEL